MLRLSRREEDFDHLYKKREDLTFRFVASDTLLEIMEDYDLTTKEDVLSFCYNGFYNLLKSDDLNKDIDVSVAILECMDINLISIDTLFSHKEGHSNSEFIMYLGRFMYIVDSYLDTSKTTYILNEFQESTTFYDMLSFDLLLEIYNKYGTAEDIYIILHYFGIYSQELLYIYTEVRGLIEEGNSKYYGMLESIVKCIEERGLVSEKRKIDRLVEQLEEKDEGENTDVETQ